MLVASCGSSSTRWIPSSSVRHAPTGSSSTAGPAGMRALEADARKPGIHSTAWRITSRATQPSHGAGLSHASTGTASATLVIPPATFRKRSEISVTSDPPSLASMFVKQSVVGGFLLHVGHTAEFDEAVLERSRQLLYVVFDDMTDHDWQHSLGGMHTIVWHDDEIIGHASVIQRRLV